MRNAYTHVLAAIVLVLVVVFPVGAYEYTDADIEYDATQYAGISDVSRWFATGDGGMYTAWANQWLEFDAYLDIGEWNIGVNVQNHGNLGENWYSTFEVRNSFTNTVMRIAASDDAINNGYVTAQIDTSGLYTVRYTWLNDKYDPNQQPRLDANIEIKNAFFDNTATHADVPVPPVSGLLLIGALVLRRRLVPQSRG